VAIHTHTHNNVATGRALVLLKASARVGRSAGHAWQRQPAIKKLQQTQRTNTTLHLSHNSAKKQGRLILHTR